jgi:ubiquinone/menaquinone biosynthesis C-methylase UbiE
MLKPLQELILHEKDRVMERDNDQKALAQQRYTRFAEGYVTSPSHAAGADLDRLLEIAHPHEDWVALDVATGGGHTALKFAPHVARVVATDLTPRMLEKAAAFVSTQGATNVTYQQADAEDLPFDADSFDLVTCRIAPHHFPDPARFVREGARVLRSGGLLLVQDHVLPEDETAARYIDGFERLRDPSHHRAFSQSEWVAMFHAAGLAVEQAEKMVKRHDFASWVTRQDCLPDVVARLEEMLRGAPAAAKAWLAPQDTGTPDASFANHHILIAGRKS